MDDKTFNTFLKQKNKEITVMERRARELIRQTKYSPVIDKKVEKEIRLLYERIEKECAELSKLAFERFQKNLPKG